MMGRYKPINDYGLIGNCRSAALVARDGSIDWCCFPRFDSPSVFAALLDAEKGGHFTIQPLQGFAAEQRYLPDTNVLEARFTTATGVCTLTDYMPLYLRDDGSPSQLYQLHRLLRCQAGEVILRVTYAPRPDYARLRPALRREGSAILCRWGDAQLKLSSPIPLQLADDSATGILRLRAGEEAAFVLAYQDAGAREEADPPGVREQLERTLRFWQGKVREVSYRGCWSEAVVRSYLALHLLTYLPTGGIIAAPTTSLPEEIGGIRNWDYRYTWLRDAAFTIEALLSLGHQEEALSFFQWLGCVCQECDGSLQIVYRIDGEAELPEEELPHLEGYRGSRPVRVGNGAYRQLQHDIYGEVLSSAYLLAQAGGHISQAQWELVRTLANLAQTRWREPGHGIWEVRGGPYHFVYSKVMCWVALDRAIALAERMGIREPALPAWRRAAEQIRREVLTKGWSSAKQAFVQHYGTEAMDASNLLLPLVGFLPPDDGRMLSTVERIRRELGEGPFLRRYRPEETDDGLPGSEGAFTLCNFWLVRLLARIGRREEAQALFQETLRYGNHLGLFAEMVDPGTGEARGNFPQAFTHIGLILAALECEPEGRSRPSGAS